MTHTPWLATPVPEGYATLPPAERAFVARQAAQSAAAHEAAISHAHRIAHVRPGIGEEAAREKLDESRALIAEGNALAARLLEAGRTVGGAA